MFNLLFVLKYIINFTQAATGGVIWKKLYLKNLQYSQENILCWSLFFNKVAGVRLIFLGRSKESWVGILKCLFFKSMDWFLYNRDLCHERIKGRGKWSFLPLFNCPKVLVLCLSLCLVYAFLYEFFLDESKMNSKLWLTGKLRNQAF